LPFQRQGAFSKAGTSGQTPAETARPGFVPAGTNHSGRLMPGHYALPFSPPPRRDCRRRLLRRRACPALLAFLLALSPLPAAAADTIPAAEPDEPSYVQACPSQGEGYFYLPGTRTCFRISGYVRHDIKVGDHNYARQRRGPMGLHRHTYASRSRATLRWHTATETDYGTLRSFVEFRTQWSGGAEYGEAKNSAQFLRFAYFELGGLRMGMDYSIFSYWTGYHGNVINDDVLTPLQDGRTNVIAYTYRAGNGFSAIIGAEQGDQEGDAAGFRYRADGSRHNYNLSQQTHNYTPNIVGGLKWAGAWSTVSAVAAYDAYYSEWAAKMRLDIHPTDRFSLWTMAGYKSASDYYALDSGHIETRYNQAGIRRVKQGIYRQINSLYGDWGGHWSFFGGGTYSLTAQTDFNLQLGYSSDKSFASSANLNHSFVPGLNFVPELSYTTWNSGHGYRYSDTYEEKATLKGRDSLQGMLRVQRSF